jgi:hypothetical protein
VPTHSTCKQLDAQGSPALWALHCFSDYPEILYAAVQSLLTKLSYTGAQLIHKHLHASCTIQLQAVATQQSHGHGQALLLLQQQLQQQPE